MKNRVPLFRTTPETYVKSSLFKPSPLRRNSFWAGCFAATLLASASAEEKKPSPGVGAGTAIPAQKTEEKREKKQAPPLPPATETDVPYGPHPKQVLDFWKAPSATAQKPAPLVLYIHGGGWRGGDRTHVGAILKPLLAAGVSVVSISYRFINEAEADKVQPPVKGPLMDAARALQTVRSKAAEWHVDKSRIAASGFSAGACSSLWLAFHDDLADPKSGDPIARESTRLFAAAVGGAQTTLDPAQMKEWIPNIGYGGHAFGFGSFQSFLDGRQKILPWIAEYSPYALVSSDDPPIHLWYRNGPAVGENQKDPTHSANFGVKLKEKLDEKGVRCELVHGDTQNAEHKSGVEFLIDLLKPQ